MTNAYDLCDLCGKTMKRDLDPRLIIFCNACIEKELG